MAAKKITRPEPVNQVVVCSVCGLDWSKHKAASGKAVGLDECVRLLMAELRAARQRPHYPYVPFTPTSVPTTPWRPYWQSDTTTYRGGSATSAQQPAPVNLAVL